MFSIALDSQNTYKRLAVFASLLAVTAGLPMVIHSQYVTGPIINTAIFLAVIFGGPLDAVLLGMTASPIALASGLLPIALAPMVPFIMLGNAVLALVFAAVWKRMFLGGVVLASITKFVFLFTIASLLMKKMVAAPIAATLVSMMGLPQLLTALLGGLLAFSIAALIRR